uniref:Venom hemolysin-like 1 n=1 Tax=Oncocephalus sp. TaxID=2944721 RepID=A0AB38ZEH8_9HEMI
MQLKLIFLAIALFQVCLAEESNSKDGSTQTETTKKPSWIGWLIKAPGTVVKETSKFVDAATHETANFAKEAGKVATDIGNQSLQGTLGVAAKGTETVGKIGKELIDRGKTLANNLPFFGKLTQGVLDTGNKVIEAAEGATKKVIGGISKFGEAGFEGVHGVISSIADKTDKTVSGIGEVIRENIDKGHAVVDNTLQHYDELTNKYLPRPVENI